MPKCYGRNYSVHDFVRDVFQDSDLPSLALVIVRMYSEILSLVRPMYPLIETPGLIGRPVN